MFKILIQQKSTPLKALIVPFQVEVPTSHVIKEVTTKKIKVKTKRLHVNYTEIWQINID